MKVICVPLLAAICLAPAWAQPSLTLAEALERARQSNPELQALALEASAVDAAGQQAALPPNPEQSLQLAGFNLNQVLEHRLKEMR